MNPLNHFGIRTQFIRGDTKSYNLSDAEIEKHRQAKLSQIKQVRADFAQKRKDTPNPEEYKRKYGTHNWDEFLDDMENQYR